MAEKQVQLQKLTMLDIATRQVQLMEDNPQMSKEEAKKIVIQQMLEEEDEKKKSFKDMQKELEAKARVEKI